MYRFVQNKYILTALLLSSKFVIHVQSHKMYIYFCIIIRYKKISQSDVTSTIKTASLNQQPKANKENNIYKNIKDII